MDDIRSQIKTGASKVSSTINSDSNEKRNRGVQEFTGIGGTSGSTFSDRVNIDAILSGVNKPRDV